MESPLIGKIVEVNEGRNGALGFSGTVAAVGIYQEGDSDGLFKLLLIDEQNELREIDVYLNRITVL
jgi:hypothetical protein